jgi:hypothetical protein
VAFSEFAKQVQKNEVRQVVIDSASNSFTFTLRPTSALYKMLPGGWVGAVVGRVAQSGRARRAGRQVVGVAWRRGASHCGAPFTDRIVFCLASWLHSRLPQPGWSPSAACAALPACTCCLSCLPCTAESLDRNHLNFQTIRPADYPTPYAAMLKNNIQFSAMDRKAGRMSTLLVGGWLAVMVWARACC